MARRLCVFVIAAVMPLVALAGESAPGGGAPLRPGVFAADGTRAIYTVR